MAAKANIRLAGLRHTGPAGMSQRMDSTVGRASRRDGSAGGRIDDKARRRSKPGPRETEGGGVEGCGDANSPLRLQSAFAVGTN